MCIVSAIDVANEFIRLAKIENDSITNLKLQKLVYFAYGWHFAHLNKKLFYEPVQAWEYGPVIKSLYHALKIYGNNPIKNEIDWDPSPIPPTSLNIIFAVYQKYKCFSALDLTAMTHVSDSPWTKIFKQGYREQEIPEDEIKDYFKGMLKNAPK